MDYLTFFGFQDAPFRLTPDPQYFFPSHSHQEALQTLLYSVRAGEGFIQITGDPGTGKTLLLRTMLKELGEDVRTALILNPNLPPQDLLRVILDDFAITNDNHDIFTRPKDQLIRLFRDFLLEKAEEGTKAVIIVDEAQNLPLETIEELRLLSNLETDKQKLLQIFLVGQRELEEKIEDASLRQLSQRITIRYCLMPFSREETATYIDHRLKIASPSNPAIFSLEIIDLIYRFSQGTPRLINIICERTLMAAYIDGQTEITKNHYNNAIRSIKGETGASNPGKRGEKRPNLKITLFLALLLIIAGALFLLYQEPRIKELFLPKTATQTNAKTMAPILNPKQKMKVEQKSQASAPDLPEKTKNDSETPPSGKAGIKSPDIKQESTKAVAIPKRIPTLPASLVGFPPKSSLLVAREGELLADLWLKEESNSKAVVTDQLQLPEGLQPGLAIAGLNRNKPFLFHPLNFLYGKQPQLPDQWNDFFLKNEKRVIPLIILPKIATIIEGSAMVENNDEKSQTGEQLRRTINEWADAWRQLDLDRSMDFYAPVMTIYEPGKLKLLNFEKERLKIIKERLFQKTENLKLDLSEPLCLTDPLNPNLAMAFFYQNYRSEKYWDRGYKALFLSRSHQEEEPDQWQISAKFFVPSR
ncbi:MAG: AAA family ATPase [Deltaproteobacteria bacterium]|nr:AAA family ATPase [Candidatus Tharpella sp.]